jgi:hypothetical protein
MRFMLTLAPGKRDESQRGDMRRRLSGSDQEPVPGSHLATSRFAYSRCPRAACTCKRRWWCEPFLLNVSERASQDARASPHGGQMNFYQ